MPRGQPAPHASQASHREQGRSAFTDTYSFVLTAASGGTHFTQRQKFTGLLISFTGKLLDETAGSFAALNEALKRRAEAR